MTPGDPPETNESASRAAPDESTDEAVEPTRDGPDGDEQLAVPVALSRWLELAELAQRTGHSLMISHEAHFRDPLVSADREHLRTSDDVVRRSLLELVEETLVPHFAARELPRGIYFPVPLERAVRSGQLFEDAVHRFHYDLIYVDEQQRWWWRQTPVAERTRDYLIEHLRYEPEIERWLFEYRVHDGWWDKSYLETKTTPLRAVQMSESAQGGAELTLQSGRRVPAKLASLRMDIQERLYCEGEGVGEVLLADPVRLRLIATMDDALRSVEVDGERYAVRWPEGATS